MHFIKETRPKAPAKKKEDHTMKRPSSRVLSLLLALVLSFFFCPAALADFDPSDYSDLKEDYWAYDSIMYCSEWEIVKGYDDGKFYPENSVSGVEFVTMVTRTFYADEVAAAQSEKPADAPWYWANVKAAGDAHVTDNTAAVNNTPMNRYDMAAVLNNVIDGKNVILLVASLSRQKYADGEIEKPLDGNWVSEKTQAAQQSIQDWDSVPGQYRNAVAMCYALGALSGMSDGTFSGTQSMTRAQACTVIVRMLKLVNDYNPGGNDNDQNDDGKDQDNSNDGTVSTAAINTARAVEKTKPGKLANGMDATPENVAAVLEDIKLAYPTGTIWGPHNTPNNNVYNYHSSYGESHTDVGMLKRQYNDGVSLGDGCGGWMCMISEYLFGKTGAPCRRVTDPSKVRVGDIVVYLHENGIPRHYAIVSIGATYSYNKVYNVGSYHFGTCDGNVVIKGTGYVNWSETAGSSLSDTCHVYTRYPD